MTAFEMETVESCPSLGMDSGGLFRPVSLIQIRPHLPQAAMLRIPRSRWSTRGSQGRTALKDSFARSVLPLPKAEQHERENRDDEGSPSGQPPLRATAA